ncbi:NAD(P)-binding domain-containing protein [Streptomyces sp. NPDC047061]|uniref:NADPH-dependent F420 reductase n=1 Tax=Streptomyces sp. NPDC047061 TaxID=3154605 RepID=UPI0033E2F904
MSVPEGHMRGSSAVTTTLGLIGAGRIGSALARLAIAAGLEVVVSNSRGPETLGELVASLGERARAADVCDAAQAGHLVAVTVPLGSCTALPVPELAGKIVIDTMNYYPERDGNIAQLDQQELTSSELVQRRLSGSRVVKAFNNIDFRRLELLARPGISAERSALPVAGDEDKARTEVRELLDVLGYDSVDVGNLAESWRFEPNTSVYVQPYLPDRPAGLSGVDDTMRWFLECPGAVLAADEVERLVRTTSRMSPATARERLD